jgi:hypothetical protein
MKVTIPSGFIERYNEKKGNWESKEVRAEYKSLKESYDEALEIRDTVLEFAEDMQRYDDDSVDTQFNKPGSVWIEKPVDSSLAKYTGTLEFNPEKGDVKPGKENALYAPLESLDAATVPIKAGGYKTKLTYGSIFDSYRDVAHTDVSVTEQSEMSYEKQEKKEDTSALFGLLKKKGHQEADIFRVSNTNEKKFNKTGDVWYNEVKTSEVKFNKDGSITLNKNSEKNDGEGYPERRVIFSESPENRERIYL